MMGSNSIRDEFGLVSHLVNLDMTSTFEGTPDVHVLIFGQAITGIAALLD